MSPNQSLRLKILVTGGGTGGHAFPALAVISELTALAPKSQFLWIGTRKGPENNLARTHEIPFKPILAGKLRRYFSFRNLLDFFLFLIGIIQSFFIILAFRPDVVYSKGGFVATPVVIASGLLRRKIIIHESDTIPGLANRISSRFARKVAISFSETARYFPNKETIVTGNPVRKEITEGSKDYALKFFNLSPDRPVIFVIGGSQGARGINQLITASLPALLDHAQIIHQTGDTDLQEVKEQTKDFFARGYRIYPFIQSQMKDAFAIADLIISRAGGTIFEILANAKPSILIPLPTSASDHQRKNAEVLAKKGAALLIDQETATPESFAQQIIALTQDQPRLAKMSQAAQSLSKPDASALIAKEVLKLATQ